MDEQRTIAERFHLVAGGFGDRVAAVAPEAWEQPAPCEGWVARDVVRHLVGWVPGMVFGGANLPVPEVPSVDDDPLAAWEQLAAALAPLVDDPEMAARPFSHPMAGDHRLDAAVDMFVTGDLLIHTWDLARAAGLDETLDPAEVHRAFVGMEQMDEMLRASGQFGARVPVPDDASEQDRFIAFTGRQP